ncbi:MAG: WhiB family transcriptional regulator [Actinomycetota bacterium]|nr:WhiB family transcriptional regulator [Actinomycetota bacterium]
MSTATAAPHTPVPVDLPCRRTDADLWFAESPEGLEQAKRLCARCPVRLRCLTAALERAEPWGVWGGEILEQGAVVARKRPRGRPRKNQLLADSAA